jgi:hypothetical protein
MSLVISNSDDAAKTQSSLLPLPFRVPSAPNGDLALGLLSGKDGNAPSVTISHLIRPDSK